MEYKEIVDLIKLVNKTDLKEVRIKNGEFKLNIRTKHHSNPGEGIISMPPQNISYPQVAASPPVEQVQAPSKAPVPDLKPAQGAKETTDANLLQVKSPIVGTFYRSASPDKPPYIKVGDTVEVGQVVCIVEAMKLFNEIESEVSGKVVKVMTEDASPVEYDQVLFLVDPS